MIFDMEIVKSYMVDAIETPQRSLIQSFQNIEELLECSSMMKMMILLIQYLGIGAAREIDTEE